MNKDEERYVTVYADIPGLDKLEDLIVQHKRLSDALESNVHEINRAISQYNITLKVRETTDCVRQSSQDTVKG